MAAPRPFDVRWTAELEAETSDLRVMGIKRSPADEQRYKELQAERGRWKARQRARKVRGAVVAERDRPPLPALPPVVAEPDEDEDDQNPEEGTEPEGASGSGDDGHDVGEVEERAPFPASTSSAAPPPPPAPEVIDARRAELRDDLVEAFEEWASEITPKPPRFLRRWTGKSLAAVAQKTGMLEHDVPIALAVILSAVGVAAFGVCTFVSLRRYVDEQRRRGPVIVDEQREAA